MKTLFFGSSSYCLPVLESLNRNFHLIAIVTKANGVLAGKQKLTKIFTPSNKDELLNIQPILAKLQPDIAVVADYGLIIPLEIIEIPKYKTINVHFSKLPDLRGASPVQYTILRGDESAWITYMLMDKGMDTGDIIKQSEYKITQSTNNPINQSTNNLYTFLFKMAAKELPLVISEYSSGKLIPQKQDHTEATYTKILTRQDGYIPWEIIRKAIDGININDSELADWNFLKTLPFKFQISNLKFQIERSIRALSPWPGIWTEVKINQSTNKPISINKPIKKRLKILKAHIDPSSINLQLDLVQLEGKKPVSWKQFKDVFIDII